MGEQGKAATDKDRGRQPSGHGMVAAATLRVAAEERLARAPGAPDDLTEETAEKVLHELQVHQIELEMQNEELKRTQVALEESRDKYLDLYDFASVGYFALTRAGQIAEVNLAGAAMLGLAPPQLVHRGLGRFVAPENRDRWDQHLVSVLHSAERQTCELTLKREDGSTFDAHLNSIRLDRPAVFDQANNLSSGQKTPPMEHRIIHRNGEIRWVRNTTVPRYDERRQYVG